MITGLRPLAAITVPFDELSAPCLRYPRLQEMVERYFWEEFQSADLLFDTYESGDTLPADFDWRQKHLLIVAYKLQQAKNDKERLLWSDRYTRVAVELYGKPDPRVALAIAMADKPRIDKIQHELMLDEKLVGPAISIYNAIVPVDSDPMSSGGYGTHDVLLGAIGEYLLAKYLDIFAVLDEYDDDELIDNETVRRLFSAMIDRLAHTHESWEDWQVVAIESTQMQVIASRRQILVGTHVLPLPVRRARSLFTHEVLVHAQRAVRGARYDKNLTYGLPGYSTAEEGLGVLMEAAVEGKMPYRVGDRYVDIALALGQFSLPPLSRPELFEFVLARTRLRWAADHVRASEDDMRRVAWQHVNRIYRGTLGNEFIGVHTKDCIYYQGYQQMAAYLGHYTGEAFYRALDFVLSGKLNPADPEHRLYIHKSRFNIAHDTEDSGP